MLRDTPKDLRQFDQKHLRVVPWTHRPQLSEVRRRKLLVQLQSHRLMRDVWHGLRGPAIKRQRLKSLGVDLFWMCERVLAMWEEIPHHTAHRHKETLNRLAQMADQLAEGLAQTLKLKSLTTASLMENELRQFVDRLRATPAADEWDVELEIERTWPLASELVQRIGSEIRSTYFAGISQPRSDRAAWHFFVRGLSREFRRAFGRPLDQVVANVTRVVYGQARVRMLDDEGVKKLRRAGERSRKGY